MIVQRDSDRWLAETEIPLSRELDIGNEFVLSESAVVFLSYLFGPPLKTVLHSEVITLTLRRRDKASATIRRTDT